MIMYFKKMGETALHWAAKRGYIEIARTLIDNNCDPTIKDFVI